MTDDLKIIVTDLKGEKHTIPALSGWRIMEIIRDNDLPIRAECGGSCTCATCHVYVDPKWLNKIPAASSEEMHQLDNAEAVDPKRSRLSCQILMRDDLDGLEVTLAPGSTVEER